MIYRRTRPFLLATVVAACTARPIAPVQTPVGCYRFNRPLSYSAAGTREAIDEAWYLVELQTAGQVSRPLFEASRRDQFARRSSWRLTADTLHIRVFDGLVGWDLALLPRDGQYRGLGQYLSDVRALGNEPPTYEFSAELVACGAAP